MFSFTLIDIIDIAIITIGIYQLLKFIKGTRAMQMFIGLLVIFFITFLANIFNLSGLSWILNSLKTVWIIAFVILFQPEIRNALTMLGKSRLVRYFYEESRKTFIDRIVRSVQNLSDRGIGALIVLEGRIGLKNITMTGIELDAELNAELLVSIFSKKSPLHDGAVIIKDEKITAAACILPLSENPLPDINLGTRHRAALGLSEETDAFIIVVSEERRTISIAQKGNLKRGVDTIALKKQISKFYL